MGWQPTPARGFHPEPHNAHALFVLRLRRLKEHVLNRHKATLSREDKRGNLFIQPSDKDRLLSKETTSSWGVLKTSPHIQKMHHHNDEILPSPQEETQKHPSDTQRQTNKPKQFLSWLQSYFQAPTKSEHKQCVSIVGSGVEQTPGGVSENGSDKPAFKDVFVLWGEFVC